MPMAQQNARFLMSAVRKIAMGKGESLKGTSLQYLVDGFSAICTWLAAISAPQCSYPSPLTSYE